MAEKRVHAITCIGCPVGCELTVTVHEDMSITVEGNECGVGAKYGPKEVTNPVRMITSSVYVEGGKERVVPVKTRTEIPKPLKIEVAKQLKNVVVTAPIRINDIIIENVLNTGVDIIATGNVDAV